MQQQIAISYQGANVNMFSRALTDEHSSMGMLIVKVQLCFVVRVSVLPIEDQSIGSSRGGRLSGE